MAKDEIDDDVNVEGLSPEERAVMEEAAAEAKAQLATEKAERDEEDALADEAVKAAKEAEEEDDDDEEEDEDEDEDEDASSEEKAAKEEAASAAEADEEAAAILAERAPKLVAFSPEDAESLEKIEADRDALLDKFDAGEMTRAEYKAGLKEIEKTAADLAAKQQRADESMEAFKEWDQRRWGASLRTWMKAHPEFTTSIETEADPGRKARSEALNEIIKQQARVENRSEAFTYADLLNEALAIYAARNPKDEAVLKASDPKREEKAKKKAAPEKKKAEIPPRLSRLPAAASADDETGFTAIDKLPGDKLEEMLMRMTPEQLDAYARS